MSNVCKSGCVTFEHQRLVVATLTPNCSDNHFPVFFCSTRTTFILFNASIANILIMDAKIHHLFVFYKVDKEKVSDWFGIADLFRPIHTNNPKLDSAAKVIKISRNQALRGDKMQNAKMQKCNVLILL